MKYNYGRGREAGWAHGVSAELRWVVRCAGLGCKADWSKGQTGLGCGAGWVMRTG